MEKTAPNMKALEKYEATRDREKVAADEHERTKKEKEEAASKFNVTRNERLRRFTEAFEHISTSIDGIYKEITKSSTHPLGGNAYLTLENPEEPFLHGIKFTAMPPQKVSLCGGFSSFAAVREI